MDSMEIKEEYIEFLRMYRGTLVQEEKLSDKSLSYEKLGDIITLLQQGEVYEKMWEELEAFHKKYPSDYLVLSSNDIYKALQKIKRKHFPKEASQDEE